MEKIFRIGMLFTGIVLASFANGQLINDGGIITISTGSQITVSSYFENKNGATTTNDGKLEVRGYFLNSSLYNSTASDDSLILSGNTSVTLNPGSSALTNLWITKTNIANLVTLAGNTTLTGKLKYEQGSLNTGAFVLSAPVAAVFEFSGNNEISGNVKRTNWQNGLAVVFHQPNMLITTTGGTAPSDFSVTMIPNGDPTDNEREVKRKFNLSKTGGSGFTTSVRYPYSDGELNTNTEANLVPWLRTSSPAEWNSKTTGVTRDGVLNYITFSNISATDLVNEWKLADPTYTFNISANLRGAWGTTSMNNTINPILPVTQPYSASPFLYAGNESVSPGFFGTHTNIVDWVLVQFRKPASGLAVNATEATEVGTKAAFILQNGSIVNLDGVSPLSMDLRKQGPGFLVIRHRNHIAVMSNSLPSNATGNYTNDFRILSNAYLNGAIVTPPLTLMPGSAQYGLWAGNANGDQAVNASDLTLVKQRANLSALGYEANDVNMDGGVNGSDLFLTKQGVNQTIVTHSSRQVQGNTLVRNLQLTTHVPH